MVTKGVDSRNGVAKKTLELASWATWLLKALTAGMVWPESLELASWATWLLKECTAGMVLPQSRECIPGHIVTKQVNSGNRVAKESGVGILGHM
eukprot:12400831-Karenia_brevis.AAC.1